MLYIGIDPGKDGAMSIIGDNDIKTYHWLEGYDQVLSLITDKSICYIERVHSQPNNGVKAAFTFGENYGYIQGLLTAYKIPYQTIPPQTWKKEFSITSDKSSSIECAKRLFPTVDLRRTDKCTKPHDGIAESLLIAEYCRRHAK